MHQLLYAKHYCNLHTVLDLLVEHLPARGKTVVLFLRKANLHKILGSTSNLDRNLGKTNPLNEDDLAEFIKLQKLLPMRKTLGQ